MKRSDFEEAPVPDDEGELFHVAAYEFKQGILEIGLLNTKLVDTGLKKSEALRKAFLKHADNEDLFKHHGSYKACIVVHEK
ncbi:MAG: hypothetical protein V3V05_11100 [Pontiella sp.]